MCQRCFCLYFERIKSKKKKVSKKVRLFEYKRIKRKKKLCLI